MLSEQGREKKQLSVRLGLTEAGLSPTAQAQPSWVSLRPQGQSACLSGWSRSVLLQPHPTGHWRSPSTVPGPSPSVTMPYPKSGLSSQLRVGGIFNPFLLGKCHCDKSQYSSPAPTRSPDPRQENLSLYWFILHPVLVDGRGCLLVYFCESRWLGAGPRGSWLIRGLFLYSEAVEGLSDA